MMSPGMGIIANTTQGQIVIVAGDGFVRSFTWEGATRSVELYPRHSRWYGSLGLYFPGPGDHWAEHRGITRGVLEEGVQHFGTLPEAIHWIENQSVPCVYRDDGLVVGWSKTPERRQLNVEVWQILIAGKKPTQLPGSQNERITVIIDSRN